MRTRLYAILAVVILFLSFMSSVCHGGKILVLADETMKGKIDPALADWTAAKTACGHTVKVLWEPRSEPGVAKWQQDVLKVGKDVRDAYTADKFDYLVIVGAVAKPYSGVESGWNGNHFNGAHLVDDFYAVPWVPIAKFTADTKTAVGGPHPNHQNKPGDGKWDVDYLSAHPTVERLDPTTSVQSRQKPIPCARIDASKLGLFGVEAAFTEKATDRESELVASVLNKSTRWQLGWDQPQPAQVIWDNAFDLNPMQFTKDRWGSLGEIKLGVWCVGDNSNVMGKEWMSYVPPPSYCINAQTGGGWNPGPYLNFGPWNNDPSRRCLQAVVFSNVKYKVNVWFMYGSYIGDIDAPYTVVRLALFQPDGCTIFVNPRVGATGGKFDPYKETFASLSDSYYASIIANVNNQVDFQNYSVGDITLPVKPSKTPIVVTDFNSDGKTNYDDLLVLSRNYNKPASLSGGDTNGDGRVDFSDLLALAQKYNSGNFAADMSRAATQPVK